MGFPVKAQGSVRVHSRFFYCDCNMTYLCICHIQKSICLLATLLLPERAQITDISSLNGGLNSELADLEKWSLKNRMFINTM